MHQPDFTPEAVAIGIDVGGQTDTLTRLESRDKGLCQGNLLGRQRIRHFQILTGNRRPARRAQLSRLPASREWVLLYVK